jgi:hypothetical protein
VVAGKHRREFISGRYVRPHLEKVSGHQLPLGFPQKLTASDEKKIGALVKKAVR